MRPTPTPVGYSPQGRPGIQGPAGPQGPQGIPGPAGARGPAGADAVGSAGVSDYGFVRFSENQNLPPTPIVPGTELPFVITAPVIIDNRLRGPFATHQFLDTGTVIRARKANDGYFLRVRATVVADVAGGTFEANLYITGNVNGRLGASGNKSKVLSEQSGDEEVIDFLFQVFPGVGFIANGAYIMFRCSVPGNVKNESLVITT